MTERVLGWSESSVDAGGTLIVPLSGEPDSDWTESFRSAIVVLENETQSGTWRRVTLIRNAIEVKQVDEGSEAALKEFLESAVRQANEDVVRRDRAHEDAQKRQGEDRERRGAAAKRMTDRFRSL